MTRKHTTGQDPLFERTDQEEEGQRRVERATAPLPKRKIPPLTGKPSGEESLPWWSR